MKLPLKSLFAAAALFTASQASAALTVVATCDPNRPDPNALDCAGYFSGNLNNNASIDDLNAALADLGLGSVTWDQISGSKFEGPDNEILNFGTTLFGQNVLSIHFGGAGEFPGDVTVLYLFDFGTGGASSVDLNQAGFSNSVIIPGGVVPEPASWALMLMGFGAAGYALRRRRKALLPQVA